MQQPASTPSDVTLAAASALARLRDKGPRVHCITNAVAQNFTANVLLSLGCVPSMTLSAEEIGGFVAGAQALLVNLGTFDAERRQATELAVKAAAENKIPWVLDPVFVDRSRPRADFARALHRPRPQRGAAQPRRIVRARGWRCLARSVSRASTRPLWVCRARPTSSPTARGWRASPTAIR